MFRSRVGPACRTLIKMRLATLARPRVRAGTTARPGRARQARVISRAPATT
jgi:hypothetical protein